MKRLEGFISNVGVESGRRRKREESPVRKTWNLSAAREKEGPAWLCESLRSTGGHNGGGKSGSRLIFSFVKETSIDRFSCLEIHQRVTLFASVPRLVDFRRP